MGAMLDKAPSLPSNAFVSMQRVIDFVSMMGPEDMASGAEPGAGHTVADKDVGITVGSVVGLLLGSGKLSVGEGVDINDGACVLPEVM